MDRRAFIGTLAGALLAGEAQERAKVPRVGVLGPGSASEMLTVQREPFEQGLRELGWKPDVNVLLEYRYGGESPTQLGKLAAELVGLGVDVLVARGPVAIRAAREATSTIPIVMATTADPERWGFIKSLARPGGTITGIANQTWELDGKRLELLKEVLPHVTRVAVLANARNKNQFPAIRGAAQSVGLHARLFEVTRPEEIGGAFELIEKAEVGALLVATDIQVLEPSRARIVAMAARHRLPAVYPWRFYVDIGGLMSYATNPDDFDPLFAAMTSRDRPESLLVLADTVTVANRQRTVEFAARSRVPAIYEARVFVDAGGLMSYGVDNSDHYRRAVVYIDKILKGAKPADLPVEQPTKFELVINLKTAKALGLTIPPSLLQRADQVIE
jgi:putative ABC transport system substrate-binding protein